MPSFMNPDYENLPDRVQTVLDAKIDDRVGCSNCRAVPSQSAGEDEDGQVGVVALRRCSRCLVAHYCSRDCQMDHFEFHKRHCKSISSQAAHIQQLLNDGGMNSDSNPTNTSLAALAAIRLGDTLVVTGYRETDTIINGSVYYRRALHYYCLALKLLKSAFFEFGSLEDRALMLLVILGGDVKVIIEWCMHMGSPRYVNWMPVMDTDAAPPEFKTQGLANNDITFQCLLLLDSMRSLAEYRRDLSAFEALKQHIKEQVATMTDDDDDERTTEATRFRRLTQDNAMDSWILPFLLGNKKDGRLHMEVLPQEIPLVVSAIRYHGNGDYLQNLQNEIPLTPEHAPNLLRNGDGEPSPTPPEFWCLFQDCFFLTPGLNDVFDEFVS